MISFEECLKLGFLRRVPPSKRQSEEQLKKAIVLLEEAKKAAQSSSPNSAVISGYAAMLDAARAVLLRDGYREKSHACVARYLEAKYSDKIGSSLVDLFDEYRDKRHKTMYSAEYYPTIEEAQRIVRFAEKFVRRIEEFLKKDNA